MTKPTHTKPFNLEHARAGAPFCCANGEEVQILTFDRKHPLCIIGLALVDHGLVRSWRSDGVFADDKNTGFVLVMTPLGYIDGKPVFVGDEIESEKDGRIHVAYPEQRNFVGARWPAPAKVYPETKMSIDDLKLFFARNTTWWTDARDIANAALRHAIDNGQVITTEEANINAMELGEAMAKRQSERDMAVARAVFHYCVENMPRVIHDDRLAAIVAGVKA